ncbi:MAG: hypothetical protein WAM60_01460 [Candidatus Promineifilaceae bacterium]
MTLESSASILRPLSMGELLDRIVRLYRQNFLTFIGIIALVQVPLSLLQLLISFVTIPTFLSVDQAPGTLPSTADFFSSFFITLVTAILSFILVQGIGTAALTWSVANNYLGKKTGIMDAYREIGRVWVSLLGAIIVAGIIGVALVVWLLIPCIGWVTGMGILLFYSSVIVPLIAPVVVLERQSATKAVGRVWGLVRERFWWVFGFAVLLLLFNYLLISGPNAVIAGIFQFGVGDPLNPSRDQLVLQTVIQTIVSLIFSLLYLPLQLIGFTLLYFDLRVRLEGFDLAILANEAMGSPTAAVETIATAPKAKSAAIVTANEMGYFAVISVGGVVIYFVLFAILGSILSLFMRSF